MDAENACLTKETPALPLTLSRLIPVPRAKLWRCWTEPALLKQWFCPKPWHVSHAEIDVRAGGASLIVMQGPAGEEMPTCGTYLEVVPERKLVFTDAFVRAWKPSAKPFMVGTVTFDDAPGGTRYEAVVEHWSVADRDQHEAMGFHQGWGMATDQLAETRGVAVVNAVVTREEWRAARLALLVREKAHTRERDALNAARAALPWVRLDKEYVFAGERGPQTLEQLFGGRSQLIVQHFMFAPDWTEGCVGCSFCADHADATLPHLAAKDVSFVAVSRAPLERLLAFRARMGWKFGWVSSLDSDFNYDFGVSFRPEDIAAGRAEYNYRPAKDGGESPGHSSFHRAPDGTVHHTYSTYARGDELLCGTFARLDIAPLGRNERPPQPMDWVRHHDRYGEAAGGCCAE